MVIELMIWIFNTTSASKPFYQTRQNYTLFTDIIIIIFKSIPKSFCACMSKSNIKGIKEKSKRYRIEEFKGKEERTIEMKKNNWSAIFYAPH